jgi:hypothetical protein
MNRLFVYDGTLLAGRRPGMRGNRRMAGLITGFRDDDNSTIDL